MTNRYAYLQAAATHMNKYQLYIAVSTTQGVIIAVGKFPVAKLADVFGRAEGYAISLFMYIIGFIIIASCHNFGALIAGTVFYAFGNTGTQIMQQIVLADITTTKWRGVAVSLITLPYIINFGVAPLITQDLASNSLSNLWRWGPGSFAIVFPVAAAPIILSLALTQRKAKKEALAPRHPYLSMSPLQGLKAFLVDIDALGLLLLCAGFLLILLPLSLESVAAKGYESPHIDVMFAVGGACIVALPFQQYFLSPKPIFRRHFVLNKDVAIPALAIGFFDFASFYISWTPAYYWVQVTHPDWTVKDATYFSNTQSLSLTIFGIAAGCIILGLKRYKYLLLAGTCIRMLGLGLMIRYRDATSTTAQVVIPQVIQGMGGGIQGLLIQLAAQVSVRHQHVAMVTAFVLLMTELGGSVGSAIVGAIQNKVLLTQLNEKLGAVGVSAAEIASAFASPTTVTWAVGSPERNAFIAAWNEYMHVVLIAGICLAAVPIIGTLFLTDHKLGDGQNCVSDELVGGRINRRFDRDDGQGLQYENRPEHTHA